MAECKVCSSMVEDVRIELGLTICKRCAHLGYDEPKKVGYMFYEHKTGGMLQVVSQSAFDDYKFKSSRKGQSSTLNNVLHGSGRLI